MPRSGRGGRRQGKPGVAYAQRSDLTQAPSAAPGQTYGAAAQQLRAQQQVPLPKQSPPPTPASAGSAPAGSVSPAGAAPTGPMVEPGGLGPLNAPSSRPGEPLTSGMSTGPGPGPEAIGSPADPTLYMLKGILARYPNPDLQALITEKEMRG